MAHRKRSDAQEDTLRHIHRLIGCEYLSLYLQCSRSRDLQYCRTEHRLPDICSIPASELLPVFLRNLCRKHGLKFPENPHFRYRHAPVIFYSPSVLSRNTLLGLVFFLGDSEFDHLYAYERFAEIVADLEELSISFFSQKNLTCISIPV